MLDIILYVTLPLVGVIAGWLVRWIYAKYQLSSSEQKYVRLKQTAVFEAEQEKKTIILEAKDQAMRERRQLEKESRDRREDFNRLEKRLQQKEDKQDERTAVLDNRNQSIASKERDFEKRVEALKVEENKLITELEKISGLTTDEAKELIIKNLENEAKHDAKGLIMKIEQEAEAQADEKSRSILVTTMQRIAAEVSSEITVTSVSLPSDEMKGRIIGREGRNIRTLETLTGVDVVIDDTPEAVVISCFDPIRKAIAKVALERLIVDGRIHPARIEEVVQRVAKEINQSIKTEGDKIVFDLGVHNIKQEGVRALGRLHYRTSYGQNVLSHSREVAIIAGAIAAEVGANVKMAKRAALLHDIGKGLETDSEGNHAEVGADICRRMGEPANIINAVAAHHNEIEVDTVEGVIVQIADAISAARPGARSETIDNYIKRLESLEKIAESFDGVERVFAIQAGRELRIMVNNEEVSDDQSKELAKNIAKEIEHELKYPGRIRVTIIRETRVVEYAR